MSARDLELPSDRKFGFFFTVIFALMAAYFLREAATEIASAFLALAAVILAVTLLKAELLHPLNKLWMALGVLLGMIVSPIVLGVIFFAVFTPVGLAMRAFGRDELRLRPSDRKTHWKTRSAEIATVDAFKRQF